MQAKVIQSQQIFSNVLCAYLVIWNVFQSILLPNLLPGLLVLGHEACQRNFNRGCNLDAKPLSQCWPYLQRQRLVGISWYSTQSIHTISIYPAL